MIWKLTAAAVATGLLVWMVLSTRANAGPFATLSAQPYGSGGSSRQVLDLHYASQEAPRPLVIFIHGGAWNSGNRHEGDPLVEPLMRAGFAVALIDYRLTDEVHFPAPLDDCQSAMRWLREHAATYHLDKEKIGVWGYSAGAHLAAMLALIGDAGQDKTAPQAVAVWAVPSDLSLYLDHPLVAALLGEKPTRDKALLASPVHYVHAGAPAFFLVHGDRDETVAQSQSVLLQSSLTQAGVPATLKILTGQDHLLMTHPANFAETVSFFHRALIEQTVGK